MIFGRLREKKLVYGAGKHLERFWMLIAVGVVTVNLFLVLTLLQMAPNLHVLAQILTSSPMQSDQLIQTEPFSQQMSEQKLLDESLIRFYMDMRFTSFQDESEMMYRWGPAGPVARLSSPSVYQTFAAENNNEKLRELMTSRQTQSVDIISVSRSDNIFLIEFDIVTYAMGQVQTRRRSANVTIGYTGNSFYGMRYSNPHGLYVRSYQESAKKS